MNPVRVIANYGDRCGEGPLWDPGAGCLYWTDIEGARFYRYHQMSEKHEVVKQGLQITGCSLNQPGGFVVANRQGIWLWDGADELISIADPLGNIKCRMNDAIADPEGRFFAGSLFYEPGQDYELGKLIRVDTDGTISVADDGFHLSNGI